MTGDITPRPTAIEPAGVQERIARIQFSRYGDPDPWIERLEDGGEAYTWHYEVPERLLAAYEQAEKSLAETRDALVKWIDETGAQEIDPWEGK